MINAFFQAWRGLKANPVRTGLTTLGIVIGIATVLTVLAAGEGFKGFVSSQVEAYGTNFLTVETRVPPTTRARNSGGFNGGGQGNSASQAVAITTLKMRDVDEIKRLPNVRDAYGAVIGQKVAAYKQVTKNVFIFGSSAERFNIDQGRLTAGRFYTETEDKGAEQVAILGSQIASDLFGQEDPVGKNMRLGEYNFLVIGVYEERGGFGFNNQDQQVFVPLVTAQKKLLGIDHLFYVLAQLSDPKVSDATAEDVKITVRKNHSITDPAKDDFSVQTATQSLETFGTILKAITFLLIAIAAISLLVGGVGIMNIMYVVVTERISEIGLKKSLGAKQSDILWEFLLEAMLITVIGGAVGVALGSAVAFGIARIANAFGYAWKFAIPLSGVALSLGVAGTIGLIFGVFPARRAAKMDPIEALRFE